MYSFLVFLSIGIMEALRRLLLEPLLPKPSKPKPYDV
jgi:hypothetical protein